ncbi:hypothetical protein [Streptomyces sp. IBSBF 2435]|uniref:hypothetical protein n=1 Tax=Streptomyces sp. IBSBF 2435 TaxID=2903531 RepID=UPI002FDC6D4F
MLFPLFIAGSLHGAQSLTGAAFTVNTVLCAAGGVHVARLTRRRSARRTRAAALGAVIRPRGTPVQRLALRTISFRA